MKRELFLNTEYASQAKELNNEVPFGYINKTVTGCGLTTICIENNISTIVACPSISLVWNKVNQYPNLRCNYKVLGVDGDTCQEDILEYVDYCNTNNQPIKVMVTYDSIKKVEKLLDVCRLVVDESDQLLKYAKMKASSKHTNVDVINYLLDLSELHKDKVSFISATPLPVEMFNREWMKEIDQITIHWSNTIKVQPILMQRTYVKRALMNEVLEPLKKYGVNTIGSATFKKVIIFFNSVATINDIIDEMSLPLEECAIKCGDSLRNYQVARDIPRLEECDNLPKYTFITSSGYAGIDLYDKEAISVVVSNNRKDWQLIDLNTDLKQAISRQRRKDNPNYNKFIFIYNTSIFSVTEEELIDKANSTKARITGCCDTLNLFKGNDEIKYRANIEQYEKSDFYTYANEVGDKWQFNDLVYNAEMYFITQTRKEYTEGFNMTNKFEKALEIPTPETRQTLSYASVLDKYEASINGVVEWSQEELNSKHYKLIDEYYKAFGELEIRPQRAQERLLNKGTFNEVKMIVQDSFIVGNKYLNSEVKTKLQKVYDRLGIKKKAKPNDLYELFTTVRAAKSNGERCMYIECK